MVQLHTAITTHRYLKYDLQKIFIKLSSFFFLTHDYFQVESGFEDDSELFGGFTATPSPVNRDPWGSSPSTPSDLFSPVNSSAAPSKGPWASTPQDPFSPPRKFAASPIPTLTVPQPAPAMAPAPGVMAFKPTIIRPKVKPNSSPSVTRAKSTASPSVSFFIYFFILKVV